MDSQSYETLGRVRVTLKTSKKTPSVSPAVMAKHLGTKSTKSSTPVSMSPRKRKTMAFTEEEDGVGCAKNTNQDTIKKGKTEGQKPEEPTEKRLRRFRAKPPGTYLERLGRVRSQRMFLIDRNRSVSNDGMHEDEVFDIAGSTGNIYKVTITKVPTCNCPDSAKGNQCKHIIYVMVNVLKAREDLAYQLALLSSELTEIFRNSPVTPQSTDGLATDTGGKRKVVEGDCPVCVMEFEASDYIVWCKAACGNNIHRHCFEQWAKSKPGQVKCVYCRTPWKGDEDLVKRISKGSGTVGIEGYVNIASELGLSGERDMSSYHQHWVNRQYGGYERW